MRGIADDKVRSSSDVLSRAVDDFPSSLVSCQNKRRRNEEISVDEIIYPPVKKRKVQFSEMVTFHASPAPTGERQHQTSSNSLWQTREELEEMRSHAKALSAEIAYKSFTISTQHQHLSYQSVLERIYRYALQSSKTRSKTNVDLSSNIDDQRGLYIWVQHGHSRRGLERWSVPSIGHHRNEQRALLVNHLLSVQHAFPTVSTKNLCKISKKFSEPAKLYALAMGKADEIAAMAEHGFGS
mmetsp:Transcript_31009/g.45844  ORF Transcript_31009/g.45844 Transcript_31009/m.45844 type:complete len:240 (+) Transcript_31009:140-859(+)